MACGRNLISLQACAHQQYVVPAQNTAVALYLSQAWQMLLAVPVVS